MLVYRSGVYPEWVLRVPLWLITSRMGNENKPCVRACNPDDNGGYMTYTDTPIPPAVVDNVIATRKLLVSTAHLLYLSSLSYCATCNTVLSQGIPEIIMEWVGFFKQGDDTGNPGGTVRDGWKEEVAKAQAGGVRVIPYLDARFFDPGDPDDSFALDHAMRFACNYTSDAEPNGAGFPNREQTDLVMGSDPRHPQNISFVVMDPAAEYWQNKMAAASVRLTSEYGVDGMYLLRQC